MDLIIETNRNVVNTDHEDCTLVNSLLNKTPNRNVSNNSQYLTQGCLFLAFSLGVHFICLRGGDVILYKLDIRHEVNGPSRNLEADLHADAHRDSLKRAVSRDFLLLFFFMNQFPPRPWLYQQGRFYFFRKLAEIFTAQGAPLVSLTPPMSLTLVANGKNLFSSSS